MAAPELSLQVLDEIFSKSTPETIDFFGALNKAYLTMSDYGFLSESIKTKLGEKVAENVERPELTELLLDTIRFVSRDRSGAEFLMNESLVEKVLNFAGLLKRDGYPKQPEAILAALKLVNNGLLVSKKFQKVFFKTDETKHTVIEGLKEFKKPSSAKIDWIREVCSASPELADEIYTFYTRALFLGTSINQRYQKLCCDDVDYVDTVLETVYPIMEKKTSELTASEVQRADNGLMSFFNAFCHFPTDIRQLNESENRKATTLFRDIILRDTELPAHIVNGAINALSVPPVLIDNAILCSNPDAPPTDAENVNHSCMRLTETLLKVLERNLDAVELRKAQGAEQAEIDEKYSLNAPLCQVLGRICTESKFARRHARMRILPPLTADQVETVPDQQDTFRGKIVRIVATPTSVKEIVSEFLLILCKRSVPRMIKYVGFGHAAGHLANMGLLGQINQRRRDSDSEDSETEEYETVRDNVNPVTGAIYGPDHGNLFDDMTEEQKEFEAMKLVNVFGQLLETGIVKPGTIGEDGKVKEVDHVLELIKNAKEPEEEHSDSDAD